MDYQWFPGHMTKAMRQMKEDIKLIDLIIELLDARIPLSSQNPNIHKLIGNKDKIIILNKSDLADEIENTRWIKYFAKQNIPAILFDSTKQSDVSKIINKINEIMQGERRKQEQKGRTNKIARVMVLGIPNVGKSSFINRISNKTAMQVGNKPGVTKQKQWIRINDKIELLDTPGVLWPKFENEKVAMNLAITGTIKDDILELTEVAYTLTKFMLENYRNNLLQRYSLDEKQINEILNQEQAENENIYEIMQLIGKKRGAILGGRVDDERTSKLILDDFRSSKLGKITLEIPE
mgnify:CR=1 FL=1